jgi:hypothetical protein
MRKSAPYITGIGNTKRFEINGIHSLGFFGFLIKWLIPAIPKNNPQENTTAMQVEFVVLTDRYYTFLNVRQ